MITKEKALELLQAFRLYAHDEFGENVSDYIIQDFVKNSPTEQKLNIAGVMQAETSDGELEKIKDDQTRTN